MAHLQTNRWSDGAQIWYENSFGASPGLIYFWSRFAEFLSFSDIWFIEQFPRICRYTADRIEIRFSGSFIMGLPNLWLNLGSRNFSYSRPLIGRVLSVHLQKNYWSDWVQSWWTNSLRASPVLINFWSCSTEFLPFHGLWLTEQFPCICRQTVILFSLDLVGKLTMGFPWFH